MADSHHSRLQRNSRRYPGSERGVYLSMSRPAKTQAQRIAEEEEIVRRILREARRVKHKDGVCWFFTGYHDENGVHHGSIDEKGRAHVHGKSAPRLVLYYRDKRSKPYSVKYNPLWAGHLAPVFCKFVGCIKPSHLFWAPPDDERRKQKRDRQIKSKRIKRKFRKYASKLTPK